MRIEVFAVLRFLLTIFVVLSLIGCDRPKEASVSNGQDVAPATAPAIDPATQPATSAPPAPSVAMQIETRGTVKFPSAILRVGTSDDKVVALLYTNDPKDALKDQYAGNSFYFQMELNADDVKDFADSDWRFESASSEKADTPYGIFLDGHRQQLQPVDVKISFEPAGGDQTLVTISGKFLLVHVEDASQPPRMVKLLAEFPAKTVLKS
jgi:hypothetical protein